MNVETRNEHTVMSFLAALHSGDLDKTGSFITDDIEWRSCISGEPALEGVFHGLDGVLKFLKSYHELLNLEQQRLYHIVARYNLLTLIGRARVRISAEKVLDSDFSMTWVFRGEKIAKVYAFFGGAPL